MKWNKEKCITSALKFQTKTEWINNQPGAYRAARKNEWMKECCKHMQKVGNRYSRLIYAYEFPEKTFYIGLTGNPVRRKNFHLTNQESQVFKYINKTSNQPLYYELTGYLNAEDASKKEGEILSSLISQGFKVLNQKPTGGLGGVLKKWTKENCLSASKTCKTKKEFREKYPSAYNVCLRHKWLDEACSHTIKVRNPKFSWTFEKCVEDARLYKTKTEWKNSSYGYVIALKNKWIKICCNHMIHPNTKWTKELCISEALKYRTIKEWRKNSESTYTKAHRNKWLSICTKHMVKLRKSS